MRRGALSGVWCAGVLALAAGCGGSAAPSPSPGPAQQLRVEVIGRRPHDPTSYTQGLVIAGGKLFESSGLHGRSRLAEIEPQTGEVLRSVALNERYFGEGLAAVGDRLIQLTWQERTALVYRISDLSQIGTFAYDTEGWGLCDDGARLVMSDGTSELYFRDRVTFELQGTVSVTMDGQPVASLNELECVGSDVYANVWPTDRIVRIDAASGRVTAQIDASRLVAPGEAAEGAVTNGIAYDAARDTFLLTGKYWPWLFEVRFVPTAGPP